MERSTYTSRAQALYTYEPNSDKGIQPISLHPGSRPPGPLERQTLFDDSGTESRFSSVNHSGDQFTPPAPYIANPSKSGVPIAEVLNHGASSSSLFSRPGVTAEQQLRHSAVPPTFSGRLTDILIDPTKSSSSSSSSHNLHQDKRRKLNDGLEANAPGNIISPVTPSIVSGNPLLGSLENNSLTLPKPTTRPVKSKARRQRIPPLLQGLHQPPPLPPEGRLFPPITGEGGGFGAGIGGGDGLEFRRVTEKSTSQSRDEVHESSDIAVSEKEKGKANYVKVDKRTPATPQSRVAGPNGTPKENIDADAVATGEAKETRKRNKWTAQETKDLLTGVSLFGVGKWKKILDCEDFHFNNRTAVDLKDRFRTCCPEGGLKATRKSRAKGARMGKVGTDRVSPSTTSRSICEDMSSGEAFRSEGVRTRKPRDGTDRVSVAELEEMGIRGPFIRAERRKHRHFTAEDDENLLKGFRKWKGKWHLIRDDEELGFSGRHATDLRDRFRVRYPEEYAEAGKKLKEREKLLLDKKLTDSKDESANGTVSISGSSSRIAQEHGEPREPGSGQVTATTAESQEWDSQPRPYLQPDTFPGPLDDLGDIFSENDTHDSHSPIVLSRTILDSNPTNNKGSPAAALPSSSAAFAQRVGPVMDETAASWIHSSDGQHIDPRALNLPMLQKSHSSAKNYPLPSITSSLSTGPLQPTSSYSLSGDMSRKAAVQQSRNQPSMTMKPSVATPSNVRFPSLDGCTTKKISSGNTLQRQRCLPHEQSLSSHPTLPTLVVPPVPSSSARNATHNLPRPADLLSMVDGDGLMREEQMPSISQTSNDVGLLGTNFAPTMRMNTLGMDLQGPGMEQVSVPLSQPGGTAVHGLEWSTLRPVYPAQGTIAGGCSIVGNGLRRERPPGREGSGNPG